MGFGDFGILRGNRGTGYYDFGTGDVFSAKEAFDMGLVSELAPDADVEKRAIAMAQQLAELPPPKSSSPVPPLPRRIPKSPKLTSCTFP